MLARRHELLSLVHDYGNGQQREAMVEILSSTQPEIIARENAIVAVQCSVPGVFWRDLAASDSTVPVTASTSTEVLSGLAESTAPVVDSLIRFRGEFSQATITDVVSGDSITVYRNVSSTEYLVVDVAAWAARLHATDSWSTTTGTDVINSVESNRGRGPMLSLNPDFETGAGRVRVQVEGIINAATAPTVEVRAKRSFI
ncbi:hypothetical protein [Zhihengliuella halotolerans]|uniref:hypothetical protein n=1 Tax=Zhihengliuella halotolerans TaxID=370736 RepID=UPI0011AEEF50|nr:hypothetical protein [Zhihengliuella halotolerans]